MFVLVTPTIDLTLNIYFPFFRRGKRITVENIIHPNVAILILMFVLVTPTVELKLNFPINKERKRYAYFLGNGECISEGYFEGFALMSPF